MTQQPFIAVAEAATRSGTEVLGYLDTAVSGLADDAEAARRRVRVGPNAVRTHRVSAVAVLVRQLRSALLGLLAAAAIVSYFVGEHTDAVVILTVSVVLGFANEYRAERAGAALHDNVRHQAVVVRGGIAGSVDVVDLVPGDVVRLDMGTVVPADIRLLAVEHLECDESVLTGESAAATKTTEPTKAGAPLGDLGSCALMGTIVRAGSGLGVVVATGPRTAFGRIGVGLSHRQPDTEFQVGLRRFSLMLAWVAAS
jgi:Mg2+-importing ATPase